VSVLVMVLLAAWFVAVARRSHGSRVAVASMRGREEGEGSSSSWLMSPRRQGIRGGGSSRCAPSLLAFLATACDRVEAGLVFHRPR
jgi:hypothetical protein